MRPVPLQVSSPLHLHLHLRLPPCSLLALFSSAYWRGCALRSPPGRVVAGVIPQGAALGARPLHSRGVVAVIISCAAQGRCAVAVIVD